MNNLLHLFEENPMKKVDKDMFRDYVRAPFPKDDDSWKDMFDIKRYNKKVHIYHHNTTGEALYGVARRDFITKKERKINLLLNLVIAVFIKNM